MAQKVKSMETSFARKLVQRDNEHTRAMRNAREQWSASERVKREKWQQEKTQAIKAMTVKGLAPELQHMMDKHKRDLECKQQEKEDALGAQEARLLEEMQRREADLRTAFAEDRERAVKADRHACAEKLHEAQNTFDCELRDVRRAHADELDQFASDFQRKHRAAVDGYEERLLQAKREHADAVARLNTDHSETRGVLQRKHTRELEAQQEASAIEREERTKRLRADMEKQFAEKESKIREDLARERDDEIELVVRKFTEEAADERRTLERRQKCGLDDMKREHAAGKIEAAKREANLLQKIARLERSSEVQRDTCKQLQSSLAESREELVVASSKITTLEGRLADAAEELSTARCDAELTLSDRMEDANKEIARLMQELDSRQDLEQQHARELERLESDKHELLEKVEEQVRASIAQKDARLAALQEELRARDVKLRETERLLREHRAREVEEELLSK